MADYRKLIDAETWAFIERTNAFHPPETASFSIAKQREIYDAMCREFHAGYPDGISASDTNIDAESHQLALRHYQSKGTEAKAAILFFHGGGFVVGGLESHDDICAEFCHHTGCDVISADYRLCPEHPHPAAFQDALAAFEWLTTKTNLPTILCGDSAGGTLAAAVAHQTRGHARAVIGQLLIYPGLGGEIDKGSYLTHSKAPMLSTSDVKFYHDIRVNGQDVSQDASFAPLADTSFADLPRTIVFSAECDPISDDGHDYCNKILAAGGKAKWTNEQGLVHGYLRARHSVTRARNSFNRIIESLNTLANANSNL